MTVQASGTAPGTAPTRHHGARAAAERVLSGDAVTIPIGNHRLELPPKDQLVYLAGLGILTALDLIEWPIALAVAVGHELARSHHGKTLREFGDALEEA
ncbi:hypothetical protein [Streptomyces sp. JNUCC 63]